MIKGIWGGRFLKKDQTQLVPSRLSFSVGDLAHGESVKEIASGIERHVVRSGNAYFYSIGSSGINGREKEIMEYAKALVIERLSKEYSTIDRSLFGKAKEVAYLEISKRMEQERAESLSYLVAHDTVGCGPFSILMEDKADIEEIEINSALAPIGVYTVGYGRCTTNMRFVDESAFRQCLNKFISENEKELSEESPIIDAQVEDARIHAQMRPYALAGAAASIRIGKGKSIGIFTLLKNQTVNIETLAYLWIAVDSGLNIVISGAPASGKTTMLGAIANFIPHYSKLVTIEEEINELRFNEPIFNVVSLYGSRYGSTDTREQVINALRMRPDRIIVGEIRREDARELFAGANLGIPFITTMHSGEESLSVIKKLMIKPMAVEPRALSMLDISIYMKQTGIRSRTVSSVNEYRWLSRAEIEHGVEVGDGDSVDISVRVGNGRTTEEVISDSKAFLRYMEKNELTKKQAAKELRRRVDFLKEVFGSSKSDEQMGEAISAYRRGETE